MAYKNQGWNGWGDWLGTGRRRRDAEWREFKQARRFARSLKLKNTTEWNAWSKADLPGTPPRPTDIPSNQS